VNEKIAKLVSQLGLKPGAPIDYLKEVERKLRVSLPLEYVDFIIKSNGAEGCVGPSSYLMLWPIEEIVSLNEAYEVDKFAPGLVLFGSDGGDMAYAFDTRPRAMPIVAVPFIGMDIKEAKLCAYTFIKFLEYLYNQD
jgi:hypothetical protein